MCIAPIKVRIRRAEEQDLPSVYALIKELALYENAPDEPTNPIGTFLKDGSGTHPKYYVLLAEVGDDIVGIALYYLGYSTWKGSMMYLDDLVVNEQYRRHGIGGLLLQSLVEAAREHGAQQLRWHVLDWNEPAIAFYKKIGASLDPTWITCKLEKDVLYMS
jgi:GNAT superfamily N-acetyltransferase